MSANTPVGFLYDRHYCFNLQRDIFSVQKPKWLFSLSNLPHVLHRTKSTSIMRPDSRVHTFRLYVLSPFRRVRVNEGVLENWTGDVYWFILPFSSNKTAIILEICGKVIQSFSLWLLADYLPYIWSDDQIIIYICHSC